MIYHDYELKPVTGQRIGEGPVEVWRHGYLVDIYPNKHVAKKKIDATLAKFKPIYDWVAAEKKRRNTSRKPDWKTIREKYGRTSQ